MKAFVYTRVTSNHEALDAAKGHGAAFLAGGTNLVDLMKYQVEQPASLIDINRLALAEVKQSAGGVSIGALVNSDRGEPPADSNELSPSLPGIVERRIASTAQHGDYGGQFNAADAVLLLHGHSLLSL